MPGYEEVGDRVSFPVAADYSANQFYVGAIDSNGRWLLNAAQGGRVDGVLQDKPAAIDRAGCIQISGICKVKVGTNGCTRGTPVTSDGSGMIESAASGDYPLGVPLETGTSGHIVPVLLKPSLVPLA